MNGPNFGDQRHKHNPNAAQTNLAKGLTLGECNIRRRNAVSAGILVVSLKKGQSHQFLSYPLKIADVRLNWRQKPQGMDKQYAHYDKAS